MYNYTWFDGFILIVIFFSTFISLVRGFMKETLSLMSWLASFYLAFKYFDLVSGYFEAFIANYSFRCGLSFIIIFISSVIIFGLLTYFILKILKISGMNTFDRLLGALFGAARGVLIVNLLIVVGSTLSLTSYVWWQQSCLIKHFTPQVVWLKQNLPELNKQFQNYASYQPKRQLSAQKNNDG